MEAQDPFAPLGEEARTAPATGAVEEWVCLSPTPDTLPTPSEDDARRFTPSGYVFGGLWHYRDADERFLCSVARYDRPANGAPADKVFRPLTYWQGPDASTELRPKNVKPPRPLYGLPQRAERPDTPLLVVEGEKAADAAREKLPDWVVVTSMNGASGAKSADWSALAGGHVVILPDADEPGNEYAKDAEVCLNKAGVASVAIATPPPGLPIGWDLGDDLPDGFTWDEIVGALDAAVGAGAASRQSERKKERPDGLPKRFEARPEGIYWREDGDDDDQPAQWFCSPLRVLALTRDKSGEGWGRYVETIDPDGGKHFWAIPARLMAGDGTEVRAALLDLGVQLASGRKSNQALSDLIMGWRPKNRAQTADRLGWADDQCSAFVLGDGRVLGDMGIVYQHESAPAAAAEMKATGTIEEWRESVGARCADNPLLVAGVSLALAGPLLEPLALDGGGVHLRGASSRGKSTIQRVAVSVWGTPRFMNTWRATANGLEGVASASNATLLALDEIGEVSGREAGAAAYMLANGVGKSRADRSGRARPSARWRTMILSSGEISLAAKMAEAGNRQAAGQSVRLIDIQADNRAFGAFDNLHGAQDGAAFADVLKTSTAASYGTAGPLFVQALIDQGSSAAPAAREFINRFVDEATRRFGLTSDGQTVRVAQRLGLIAAAGETATGLGLTGWRPDEASGAAMTLLELWLGARGGAGPQEAKDAVERVRAFILAHGSSRFERFAEGTDPGSRPSIINRAGWTDGEAYYFGQDAWREVHKGADPRRAARYLTDAGLLIADEGGRHLTKRMPRAADASRPRAYAVKAEIMGVSHEE